MHDNVSTGRVLVADKHVLLAFIANLMEAGVEFEAVDLPQANKLTLHVMAALAEHEAAAISARTKAALAAANARGTQLGGYRWEIDRVARKGNRASAKARAEQAAKRAQDLLPLIESIKAEGNSSLRQIASALNERGITTARGKGWAAAQVHRVLNLA